jgi:hypothetical protein
MVVTQCLPSPLDVFLAVITAAQNNLFSARLQRDYKTTQCHPVLGMCCKRRRLQQQCYPVGLLLSSH